MEKLRPWIQPAFLYVAILPISLYPLKDRKYFIISLSTCQRPKRIFTRNIHRFNEAAKMRGKQWRFALRHGSAQQRSDIGLAGSKKARFAELRQTLFSGCGTGKTEGEPAISQIMPQNPKPNKTEYVGCEKHEVQVTKVPAPKNLALASIQRKFQ